MLSLVDTNTQRYTLTEAIQADVSRHLYEAFSADGGLLSNVDRWTQRKVTLENLAKIELALESEDAANHCYQNLIREVDTEAESGIYLVRDSSPSASLCALAGEPGVSGKLHGEMPRIAPLLFADETARSNARLDLVWITIQARYDRARVDAQVSEIMLGFFMDDAAAAADTANALRSMMYSFHEDATRRLCGLPLQLNERDTRELVLMIASLESRAGDYDKRVMQITQRADT